MRLLTRYILKEHLLPFIYALLILVLLLLTNFLLRAVDRLLGKGLPLSIILEYLALNMAWILALAVPMAVLVATLMAFGRFSEDNEIAAMRASGVSFQSILWPALAFSIVIAGFLTYFNNAVLPNMNHRTRLLSRDIYRKRPDLNIEPGYFIDDLPQYSLIVKGKRGNRFQDVRIYSKDSRTFQTSIHAEEGEFSTVEDAIVVTLYNGEIHELDLENFQNYRRIKFKKHRITIPADNLSLRRRDSSSRSDREMTVAMMEEKIATYEGKIATLKERIAKQFQEQLAITAVPQDLAEATELLARYSEKVEKDTSMTNEQLRRKQRTIRSFTQRLKSNYRVLEGYRKNINRYAVEIHKKFSIPVACIVFVLVGAPLGVMAKKGGFVTAVTFSFGFFLIYWVFLIAGEELADRNFLSPIIAMWAPNVLLGVIGILLSVATTREQRILRIPLLPRLKKKEQTS